MHILPFTSSIAATNTANANNPIIINNEIRMMFLTMIIIFVLMWQLFLHLFHSLCIHTLYILLYLLIAQKDKPVFAHIKRIASSNCENDSSTYCIDTCLNTFLPHRNTTIIIIVVLNVSNQESNDVINDDDEIEMMMKIGDEKKE